jgi:hypothetical protein
MSRHKRQLYIQGMGLQARPMLMHPHCIPYTSVYARSSCGEMHNRAAEHVSGDVPISNCRSPRFLHLSMMLSGPASWKVKCTPAHSVLTSLTSAGPLVQRWVELRPTGAWGQGTGNREHLSSGIQQPTQLAGTVPQTGEITSSCVFRAQVSAQVIPTALDRPHTLDITVQPQHSTKPARRWQPHVHTAEDTHRQLHCSLYPCSRGMRMHPDACGCMWGRVLNLHDTTDRYEYLLHLGRRSILWIQAKPLFLSMLFRYSPHAALRFACCS